MKKFFLIACAFIAIAAVSSCTDTNEPQAPVDSGLIRIDATVGTYTKATDTAFEQGDKIGLYAGAPLNFTNIPLEYKNNSFTCEQELRWAAGQTGKTSFRAYYPYFAEIESQPENVAFTVKKNQSQHADFTASDLMFATAEASPSDESVKLAFNHLLSKLVVDINNKSGDAIREIMIVGPQRGALVNRVTGAIGNAVADPDDGGDEVIYHPAIAQVDTLTQISLILPPQKCMVGIVVITASGRTSAFVSKNAEFVTGKMLKGAITLKEVPVGDQVEFTLSINDWEEGDSIRFTDKEVGKRTGWSIYYYPSPFYYRKVIRMEEKVAGAFYGVIDDYRSDYYSYSSGTGVLADQFYFISDNDRFIFGTNVKIPQEIWERSEWPVTNGGSFLLESYAGPLGVWFYPDEGMMEFERISPNWKKLGTGEFVHAFYQWGGQFAKAYDVEIYEDMDRPGVYRLDSPFEYWSEQESFHGPWELTIDASDPEKVMLRPAVFCPGWEYDEMLYTNVPENRGKADDQNAIYGTLKDGIIRFPTLDGYSREYGNNVYNSNVTQIVLPGYKREPLVDFNYYDLDQWETVNGVPCAVFEIDPWLDIESISYILYPGKLDYNTINNNARADFRAGKGTKVEFTPGQAVNIYIPITQSGLYTLAFYGESPTYDKSALYSTNNYFVLPDGSMPEAYIALSNAKPHELFPDKAATVHLDFANGADYRVRAISSAAAAAGGLTEDNYYDYAMAGYAMVSQTSFFNGVDGSDIAIVGLEPETEYLVLAAGKDVFGRAVYTSTTVTTGAAPLGWASAGTGTWTDGITLPAENPFTAQVQLLQVQGTERYRAVQPYASFWTSGAYSDWYAGSSTDFEFCLKTVDGVTYIYYLPFRTGYLYASLAQEGTQNGWVTFMFYDLAVKDPSKHIWTKYNKAISDGVYNIAPYGMVTGTTGYFGCMTANGDITIAMPGKASGAPAAPAQAPVFVETSDTPAPAVVFGEHKVAPFEKNNK